MRPLTAIIVDDEAHQQEYLSALLASHGPRLQLLNICASVAEALEKIPQHKPDVVFLDVEMPGKTGFDLLREIESIDFEVVFTTAFSKYAVEAFRVAAIDFLLKPLDPAALDATLTRLEERIAVKSANHGEALLRNLLSNLKASDYIHQKIALPVTNGLVLVRLSEIIRCQVQGNYTVFFMTNGDQHVVCRTITECESTLMPPKFRRVHQSHLINMGFMKKFIKGEGGEIELENGHRVPVSRRLRDELMKEIAKL